MVIIEMCDQCEEEKARYRCTFHEKVFCDDCAAVHKVIVRHKVVVDILERIE